MREKTPSHLRCHIGKCPSVFEDGDDLVIIGKPVTDEQLAEVSGKIGNGELVIRINKAFLPGSGAGGGN